MRRVISWRRRSDGDLALHVGKTDRNRLRPSQSLLQTKKLTGDDMTLTSFHRMLTAVGLLIAPAPSPQRMRRVLGWSRSATRTCELLLAAATFAAGLLG